MTSPVSKQVLDMIPSMSPEGVLKSLEKVGEMYTGQGVAVECGTWFGRTAIALATGLATRHARIRSIGPGPALWLFDKWQANAEEVKKAARFGVTIREGQDLRPLAVANIERCCHNITLFTTKGRIEDFEYPAGIPIEIFVLDAAKRNPSFSRVIQKFSPWFIKGKTIIVLLDYYFFRSLPLDDHRRCEFEIQYRWANKNSASLEPLHDLDSDTARFFLVTGELSVP